MNDVSAPLNTMVKTELKAAKVIILPFSFFLFSFFLLYFSSSLEMYFIDYNTKDSKTRYDKVRVQYDAAIADLGITKKAKAKSSKLQEVCMQSYILYFNIYSILNSN